MKRPVLRSFGASAVVFPPETEKLIRSELFSVERLEQHAESLAAAQRVTANPRTGRHLVRRPKDNGRVLLAAYRGIEKAVREDRAVTPAAQWLLAWALVAHTDSRFDRQMLVRFVGAYQRVQPLTIGELWAVAITLRIVLIENLRRAAERIANGRGRLYVPGEG